MKIRTLIRACAVAGLAMCPSPSKIMAQQEPAAAPERKTIEVIARQFEFEPSRIEVVEGDRVRLIVHSTDSPHGFEIKKFNVNKLIPRGGDKITIDFVASAAGTFPFLCSEECGEGHENMKGTLIVQAKPK